MREEDVVRLRAHWLFENVPDEMLTRLLTSSRLVGFLASEEIFAEGDEADGLYFVVDGRVRIVARGLGSRTILKTLSQSEIFGEMGVLDGKPRSGTATAVTGCRLFFLPAPAFLELLEHSSLVCNRLLVLLAQRLRITNSRLAELPGTQPLEVLPKGDS
jgi:CRP-like cAMP-binding protein